MDALNPIQNRLYSTSAWFTATRLPVGLQIVGRRSNDLGVLQLANAFEKAAVVAKPCVPVSVAGAIE